MFESHWKYIAVMTASRLALRELDEAFRLSLLRLCPSRSLDRRLLIFVMRLAMAVQDKLWWSYIAAKFAPWRWWLLARVTILFRMKIFLTREKLA